MTINIKLITPISFECIHAAREIPAIRNNIPIRKVMKTGYTTGVTADVMEDADGSFTCGLMVSDTKTKLNTTNKKPMVATRNVAIEAPK